MATSSIDTDGRGGRIVGSHRSMATRARLIALGSAGNLFNSGLPKERQRATPIRDVNEGGRGMNDKLLVHSLRRRNSSSGFRRIHRLVSLRDTMDRKRWDQNKVHGIGTMRGQKNALPSLLAALDPLGLCIKRQISHTVEIPNFRANSSRVFLSPHILSGSINFDCLLTHHDRRDTFERDHPSEAHHTTTGIF